MKMFEKCTTKMVTKEHILIMSKKSEPKILVHKHFKIVLGHQFKFAG